MNHTYPVAAASLLLLCCPSAHALDNLLVNGDFETGDLTGWTEIVNAEVLSDQVHGGVFACHQPPASGGRIRQTVSAAPGQAYKVTAWFYIVQTSNVQWGGIRIIARDAGWNVLDQVIMTSSTHGSGTWYKVALAFTATDETVHLDVGKSANSDAVIEFYADDVLLFEDDGTNPPPEISISVTPDVVTSIPANVDYEVTGDDPNGAIEHIYWSFGEGGHRLNDAGQYTYVSPGTYTVDVTAVDDQGATASASTTVSISDTSYPLLTIDSPASDPTTVTQDSITVAGQTTGAAEVHWSTDRGEVGVAAGTASFSATVPLHPGQNRLLVNAYAATGEMTSARRQIHYYPTDPLAVANLNPLSASVERWEPFVVEFDIENTRATELEWPYETDTPLGVTPELGITVNGEFSDDDFTTTLVQPAFYYQPYVYEVRNSKDWLRPQGQARWVVRFAPPRLGAWQYRIVAIDAGGSATSTTESFTVVSPTDPGNHGFVRVNDTDTRYFQFDDGTHFTGVGHNENYTDVKVFLYKLDDRLLDIGNDSANFFRMWTTGLCMNGSAHPPLLSATLPYVGYLPAEGLTPKQAYADGDVSVRLDASNPCMFYGWLGGDTALEPGHTYRIRVRVKLIEVTGPAQAGYDYGFTVKRIGWPDPPADFFPDKPAIIAHRTGSLDWAVLEGDHTATGNYLGYLSVLLENTTGGKAYVDEISIREVLGGDQLGPELNRRPKMNYHKYFCDLTSWQYDYMLERARELGLYYRIAVTERNDYVLSRLGHAGFMETNSSPKNFNAPPGTACYTYQTYWWRYLTARWGAYRSVHSWELANEQDPWDSRGYVHTQNMAAWFHANDPSRHDAVTTFWDSFPATEFWANPAYPDIAHADIHEYLYDGTPENSDTAYGHWDLGRDLASRGVDKPIVRSETGVLGPAAHGGGENADIKLDTEGIYLHNLTWATLDYNGMYELYWFANNIRGEGVGHGDLYDVYRTYRSFMADVPLGNGSYIDAGATSSHPSARVVGQIDPVNNRGHFWIQHADHTWRNVVDEVEITSISTTIEVLGLASPAKYAVTWFNTYDGSLTTEVVSTTAPAGALLLNAADLVTDVAVKLNLDSLLWVRPEPGTLVFQDGRLLPDNSEYTGTRDAHILQGHSLYNTGGHEVLEAARQDGSNASHDRSIVVKFTEIDTSLEAGNYLQQAVLTLDYFGSRNDPGGVSKALYVHKLLHDWGEGAKTGIDGAWAGPGEVCWTKPFGATGGDNPNWNGTLDAQYADPVTLDSASLASEAYGPVSFDVTDAVRQHLADPGENFGFVIREEEGSESTEDGTRQFHSREAVYVGARPSLTLTFVELSAADFDLDGDVDLDDYSTHLVPCYTGPGGQATPECEPCDLDNDADVDLIDLATFQCSVTQG